MAERTGPVIRAEREAIVLKMVAHKRERPDLHANNRCEICSLDSKKITALDVEYSLLYTNNRPQATNGS